MTRDELNEIARNTLLDFIKLHRKTICNSFVERQDFTVENEKFVSIMKDFLKGTTKEERQDFLLIVFSELGKEYEDVLRTSVGVPVGNSELNRYLDRTSKEIVYELGF